MTRFVCLSSAVSLADFTKSLSLVTGNPRSRVVPSITSSRLRTRLVRLRQVDTPVVLGSGIIESGVIIMSQLVSIKGVIFT